MCSSDLIDLAARPQRHATVVEGHVVGGILLNRDVEVRDRLVGPAHRKMRSAAIVERHRIVRSKLDRGIEIRDRTIELTLLSQ